MPENLNDFFKKYHKAAIAFSGGVDSAYLLYAAKRAEADVKAYFVKSSFQPQFELEDAVKIGELTGAGIEVLREDILSHKEIADNPENRCYYCKKRIFSVIAKAAKKDGYDLIFDGTNASDEAGDRPGMKALRELQIRSPLRECGLTKPEIRRLSKEAGLFTWNKPSYACLATRIQAGEVITQEKLSVIEETEDFLAGLGFKDFRIRMFYETARIQVVPEQLDMAIQNRKTIVNELKKYYKGVVLDLETRG